MSETVIFNPADDRRRRPHRAEHWRSHAAAIQAKLDAFVSYGRGDPHRASEMRIRCDAAEQTADILDALDALAALAERGAGS